MSPSQADEGLVRSVMDAIAERRHSDVERRGEGQGGVNDADGGGRGTGYVRIEGSEEMIRAVDILA